MKAYTQQRVDSEGRNNVFVGIVPLRQVLPKFGMGFTHPPDRSLPEPGTDVPMPLAPIRVPFFVGPFSFRV